MSDSSTDARSADEAPLGEGSDSSAKTGLAESAGAGPMPIVGVGASAGGIDALQRFLGPLPADSGMAFVVILHLSPDHESNLASILQECTALTVEAVADRTEVQPDHVYVITPGHRLDLQDGILRVSAREASSGAATIDRFFRSLAADQGRNAVGMVLSGTGNDGTLGLREINEKGGVTFAQAPKDAEYDDMPQSAIAMGRVDLIAPAGTLAEKLVAYRTHAGSMQVPVQGQELDENGQSVLREILNQLYATTGHDFSNYEHSMVLRRLGRRLQLNAAESLDEYLRRLRNDEKETRALYRDLLDSITSFFKGPEAFAALEEQVIPRLFEAKTSGDQVRVWVPGCATGEEAYSLAILLKEYADTLDHPPDVEVFATDVDEEALDMGRKGLYPETIREDLTEERVRRFFERDGNYYRVDRSLREMILFAPHNLLTDPPYSDLDLVSCRNLLVYFNEDAREEVFNRFHYALPDGGYLFLGPAERSRQSESLFSTVDGSNSILRARARSQNGRMYLPGSERKDSGIGVSESLGTETERTSDVGTGGSEFDHVHHMVLMDSIASILVNDNEEIVHLSDRASRYLRFQEGVPSRNLFSAVPKPLRPGLRSALYQAFQKGEVVERTGVPVPVDGETQLLDVVVQPVEGDDHSRLVNVRIDERPQPASPATADGDERDDLREELDRTREQLETTKEEYDAATEEMEAANEELLSMNEELQCKNEELETRREEVESLNEELKATNQALNTKIEELREAKSVLENLMAANDIATLFLDEDLKIQRYTPRVTDLFSINTEDVGRPLADFTQRFEYEDLIEDARAVLSDLKSIEREVHASDDRWFLLRLRPFRTVEDRVEGVVITFIDITGRRAAEEALQESKARLNAHLEQLPLGTGIVDEEGKWVLKNPALEKYVSDRMPSEVPEEHDRWRFLREDGTLVEPEQWPGQRALRGETVVPGMDGLYVTEDGAERWTRVSATPFRNPDGETRGAILIVEDIHEQKQTEEELRRERNFVDRVLDTVGALVMVLDRQGRVLRVNNECEDVTGYSADELRGVDSIKRLVPSNEVPEVRDSFLALLRGEAPIRIENHIRTKDGEQRLIDWTSTVLRDDSGEVQFVIGTGIDITERRALEQEVISAGERVRREIGQDLHDVLSSDLAALAMRADNLTHRVREKVIERTAAADALQDVVEGIRQAAEQSRNLSHALIPVALQKEHLAAALENLCREQEDLTGVSFTFEGDREEHLPRDDETAMHLYRIAHEAVTNVRRHAEADHVRVSLQRSDEKLVLTVTDDGIGLPEDLDGKSGVGLRTMDYRASVIGASLTFDSGTAGGTTVRCSLPLHEVRAE